MSLSEGCLHQSAPGKRSFRHTQELNLCRPPASITWLSVVQWVTIQVFLLSLGTERCLIRHLKATVNLYRPHHKWFFSRLSDLKHQLVSIHTYYLSLIKAVSSESKILSYARKCWCSPMNKKDIYVLSFFKRHPVKCLPLHLFCNSRSMQSSSPEDALHWDWWSCSEASLFPRSSVGGQQWHLSWCCSSHWPGQLHLMPALTPGSCMASLNALLSDGVDAPRPASLTGPKAPGPQKCMFSLAQKSSFSTTESMHKSMEGSVLLRGRQVDR